MKIESTDISVKKLLNGNFFSIPRFQRPYSWEIEQISDFWADVLASPGEGYFIGSMVVYSDKNEVLNVVDGQQRLTTISILLAAIRDGFKRIGSDDLATGLQRFIETKDTDNKDTYILKTETSFPFLQEYVFKSDAPEVTVDVGHEERAIQRAYNHFKTKVDGEIFKLVGGGTELGEDQKERCIERLKEIRDTVLSLNLILITLDNEDDAYLIFETLNTRGKDLSLSDLLKNHFAKLIKAKGDVDSSVLSWNKVIDTVNESSVDLDPDTFVVHYWQSKYDFVTKGKAFKKIKSHIGKENAKAELSEFVRDVKIWRGIFETEYYFSSKQSFDKSFRRSLEALRIFKVVQPMPGVLSLLRAASLKKVKPSKSVACLQNIEKFHFMFNAITQSRSSGGISGMYSSFGRQVFEAETSQDVIDCYQELKRKLQDRVPAESEFDVGFEQIYFTNSHTSQKALIRYILRKIAIHTGQPFLGETEDLTIEHLIPQSRIGKLSEQLVGSIGNLMLVDQETNNLLGTKTFEEKREILIERGYKLTPPLHEAKSLSEDVLKSSTEHLAQIARDEVWRI